MWALVVPIVKGGGARSYQFDPVLDVNCQNNCSQSITASGSNTSDINTYHLTL
jgi:hypothetical protein